MPDRDTVLFVCTHNSARSQMAEGLLRAHGGERYRVFSAGTHPGCVHPMAIRAMAEASIDISSHKSKHVDTFASILFDYVVTVCDNAAEACPYIPARKQNLHRSFEDPSRMRDSDDLQLAAFRRIRDEVLEWLEATFALA